MSIFSILGGPITKLVGEVGKVIDNVHTSEAEKLDAKERLQKLAFEAEAQILSHAETLFQSQRDVLVAEAKGESAIQRMWRPITMLSFVFIILNNYVIVPYVSAFGGTVPALEIPNGLWALLNVGIGGYIFSRGAEKIVKTRNGK